MISYLGFRREIQRTFLGRRVNQQSEVNELSKEYKAHPSMVSDEAFPLSPAAPKPHPKMRSPLVGYQCFY